MSKPKISIILPFYQAADVLMDALASIQKQTFTDFEAICLDDGSTDNAHVFVERVCAVDKRFRLYRQKNTGAGPARNKGLSLAKGTYVFFMDADDLLHPMLLEKTYQAAIKTKAHIVLFETGLFNHQTGHRTPGIPSDFWLSLPPIFNSRLPQEDKKDDFFLNAPLVAWNKVFERTFLIKKNLSFVATRTSEDLAFNMMALSFADRITYLSDTLYDYRIQRASSLSNKRARDLKAGIKAFETAEKVIFPHRPDLIYALKRRELFQYVTWIRTFIGVHAIKSFYNAVQTKIKAAADLNSNRLYARMDTSFFDVVRFRSYPEAKYFVGGFALFPAPKGFLKKTIAFASLLPQLLKRPAEQAQRLLAFKKEIVPVSPINRPHVVPIVFAVDKAYTKPLSVAIQSILEQAHSSSFYDIIILEKDLSGAQKEALQKQVRAWSNVSLRFWNTAALVTALGETLFHTSGHISLTAYYRLFIPLIFKAYDRVLYLDCDLVALKDVASLYRTDIGTCALGAVRDFKLIKELYAPLHPQFRVLPDYLKNKLRLKSPDTYFNSGVLVMNLKQLRRMNFVDKAVFLLYRLKTPLYHDQDILNSLCQGRVHELKSAWNFCWHVNKNGRVFESLPPSLYQAYVAGEKKPFIVHFASIEKPWNGATYPLSSLYFDVAARVKVSS